MPAYPAVDVDMAERGVLELLGGEDVRLGVELSDSYRNETLNVSRVQSIPAHPDHPEYTCWQVPVRGYPHESPDGTDTVELAAHFELEPTEYPRPHVGQVGLEVRRSALALRVSSATESRTSTGTLMQRRRPTRLRPMVPPSRRRATRSRPRHPGVDVRCLTPEGLRATEYT